MLKRVEATQGCLLHKDWNPGLIWRFFARLDTTNALFSRALKVTALPSSSD
jgi:hypothetical protein